MRTQKWLSLWLSCLFVIGGRAMAAVIEVPAGSNVLKPAIEAANPGDII